MMPTTPQLPAPDEAETTAGRTAGFSRRRLVQGAGIAGALGIAGFGGAAVGGQLAEHRAEHQASSASLTYPFRGQRQQGILTPVQDNMYTAFFDLRTEKVEKVRELLAAWTVAAEQMCAGELVGGEPNANPMAPPKDTGEVWGYPPAGLSITFGFGRGLFEDAEGRDRYGLQAKMPQVVAEGIPKFPNEVIRTESSGGDLMVQACANDPQVCVHAIRNLTRIGFGTVALRWGQIGYGRTSSTSTAQQTPRNLFGFKDGTANLKAEDGEAELAEHLWVQEGDDAAADWLAGGTYLVLRKIKMHLEIWDRVALGEQQEIIGRDKHYGAPLSVENPSPEDEFTAPEYGTTAIAKDAHIAVVSPQHNGGARMLRRGYNYTDGNDSLGRLDAGLFFIACVRDPRKGFYPTLQKMTRKDALTEYLQHVGTGLFAIPRGVQEGERMIGQSLFA